MFASRSRPAVFTFVVVRHDFLDKKHVSVVFYICGQYVVNIGQYLSNICQYLSMYGTVYIPTYYTVLRTVRYCVLVLQPIPLIVERVCAPSFCECATLLSVCGCRRRVGGAAEGLGCTKTAHVNNTYTHTHVYIYTYYRLCRRPLGPEEWILGCLDVWILILAFAW